MQNFMSSPNIAARLRCSLVIVTLCLATLPAIAATSPEVPVGVRRVHHVVASPNATITPSISPRRLFAKPSHDDLLSTQNDNVAVLKIAEGTGIRLRSGILSAIAEASDLRRAGAHAITGSMIDVQLARLNAFLKSANVQLRRTFNASEETLQDELRSGERRSGQELPDLNLYFELRFPDSKVADIVDTLAAINELDVVEFAGPIAKPAPPPVDISPPTPNFHPSQTYFAAAPDGIDVLYAQQLPGGRGESVRVVDVETAWLPTHEDWPTPVSTSGNDYNPPTGAFGWRSHGTAVVGIIAALENGYGTSGIAPSTEIALASPNTADDTYDLPNGVQQAYQQSRPGDLILIEQQLYYNYPTDQALCPPEWAPGQTDGPVFAAIQSAVANGRIVIETAGNGAQNLDDATRFNIRFNRAQKDSGAIYVGAGRSTTHAPMSFSNYGSRLDVQGWGENIVTLGYGDLFFPGSDPAQSYTSTFGGTSGAAPIATGAAALLQAIRRARALPDLTSQQMRAALQVGATPQAAGVLIGPLPNLRQAVAAMPINAPTIVATGSASGAATITWSSIPGASGYEVSRKDAATSSWQVVQASASTPFLETGLAPGKTYLYSVRAYDAAGNRSPDSNYETATTITYSDATLSPSIRVRARHMVEVRTAINAICTFAGTAICPAPPFSGAALDEAQLVSHRISVQDFLSAQNQIITLRAAIGASQAVFRGSPNASQKTRIMHMEDLRNGAN